MDNPAIKAQVDRILDLMDDARERRHTGRITAKDRSFMVASPMAVFSREMFGEDDADIEGYAHHRERDAFLTEDNGVTISNIKGQTLVGSIAGDVATGREGAIHRSCSAELALRINLFQKKRRRGRASKRTVNF